MQTGSRIKSFSNLFHAGPAVHWVNLLTLYRIIAFPALLTLVFLNLFDIFKWLLIVSFLTDALDGYLARKFKATSVLGAKLDSIGDDLTVLAGVLGLWVLRTDFLKSEIVWLGVLFALFLLQLTFAISRYRKMSNFHTYGAKLAAILQGLFLCSVFLFERPVYWLFYLTAAVTAAELIEETIIVWVLQEWTTDVRGLYWILRDRK